MFAAVFITVISIQKQVAQWEAQAHHFTVTDLFRNQLFFTLIVSMASTYLLYFLMSLLFFDPWHMVTSVSPSPHDKSTSTQLTPNTSSSNTSS